MTGTIGSPAASTRSSTSGSPGGGRRRRMVCKVDDLELTEFDDGVLGVTALLSGAAALVPRLGESSARILEDYWHRLGTRSSPTGGAVPDRARPGGRVGQRRQAARRAARAAGPADRLTASARRRRRRLNELLQMQVRGRPTARPRAGARRPPQHETASRGSGSVIGLVVGRGRPGSYLGYDRDSRQGPWLVGRLVRRSTGTRATSRSTTSARSTGRGNWSSDRRPPAAARPPHTTDQLSWTTSRTCWATLPGGATSVTRDSPRSASASTRTPELPR